MLQMPLNATMEYSIFIYNLQNMVDGVVKNPVFTALSYEPQFQRSVKSISQPFRMHRIK